MKNGQTRKHLPGEECGVVCLLCAFFRGNECTLWTKRHELP